MRDEESLPSMETTRAGRSILEWKGEWKFKRVDEKYQVAPRPMMKRFKKMLSVAETPISFSNLVPSWWGRVDGFHAPSNPFVHGCDRED